MQKKPTDVEGKLSQWQNMFAGGTAGAVTRFLCQPFDVLKIRFQVQIEPLSHTASESKYKSVRQACRLIYLEEGVLGFWKGHNPAQVLSIGYGVTQFSVYEYMMQLTNGCDAITKHTQIRNFVCGGIAGGAASIVATPLDVIRTRIIVQDKAKGYTNSIQATRVILQQDGIRGLYRGFTPSLMQIIPLAGLNFLFYNFYCDQLQKMLNLERHQYE